MVLDQGDREVTADFPVGCLADDGAVPVPKDPQSDLPSRQDILKSDGNRLFRHGIDGAVSVPDGIDRPRLSADGEDSGREGGKLFGRQIILCLVKGQMPVDTDATEADVHATEFLNQLVHPLPVLRIGENSLFLWHHQFFVNL